MLDDSDYSCDASNEEGEGDFGSRVEDFRDLSLSSSDWTVETLYSQIDKGNIELSPGFQRREVWNVGKKSAFIESLLLGIPVPQIVIAQQQGRRGKYLVLDGKQRLLSIYEFYKGEYGLRNPELLPNLRGMRFDDFDDEVRDALDNATIRAVRLGGWKTDSVLYTIFHRLNTGSVSLNTQELRSALLAGPFTEFAGTFTNDDLTYARLFNSKADGPDFRMRDVELFTRYCGITRYADYFQGNLKDFLDATTRELNQRDDVHLYQRLADESVQTIELYSVLYGKLMGRYADGRSISAFSLVQDDKNPRFNRAVFDALCYPAQEESVRTDMARDEAVDDLVEALYSTLGDQEFIEACTLSTKTRRSLVTRVNLWGSRLSDVLGRQVKVLTDDSLVQ